MGNPSKTELLEMFRKHIEVLDARLEILKKLSPPLEAPPLPRVPPPGLLRLPFEIRLQIYRYCIPRKHVVEVSSPRFYIGWPYVGVDHTLGSEDILSSKEDTLDLEDDAVEVEDYNLGFGDTLSSEEDALGLEDDAVNLEDYNLDLDGDYWNPNKNRSSIFRLSKQISEEALDILYGENIFKLCLHGEGEVYLKKNFTAANRQRMRYLLVTAEPRGVSYEPRKVPDNSLWSSILPTLKGLRVIAEQPVQASSYYGAPTLEQEMERWVKWTRPFLQCFGQHLSRETIVQVDIDGRAETRDLVKEYLSHGYREIRCRHVGDLMFKRGWFSWESGYWDDDGPINSRDADGDWNSD